MSSFRFVLALAAALGVASLASAQAPEPEPGARGIDPLAGTFAIAVGFGEIPFLSGSFKPSVSFGYHLNRYVYFGAILQLRDILERGSESFNARNTELGGIEATREQTGVRFLLQARVRPHRYAPYLSVGALFNGSDTETMHFDARQRELAGETHAGALTVEQTRPYGLRPAIGLGYGVTLDSGFTMALEMTGAFFMRPPKAAVRVSSSEPLSDAQREAVTQRATRGFASNFHNRYHLFNIAAGYAW